MAENKGKMTTGLFRLSFPQLWEPKAAPGSDKEKYGLTMLFEKGSPDLAPLKKMAFDTIMDKWGTDKAKWPANLRRMDFKNFLSSNGKDGWPFRDGDAQDYDGYAGMTSVSARSDTKPIVVDRNKRPIIEKDVVYAGCYGHAVITCYAWEHKVGGCGVSFGLLAFMMAKDGEPFTRRFDPETDFAGVDYSSMQDAEEGYSLDDDIPF